MAEPGWKQRRILVTALVIVAMIVLALGLLYVFWLPFFLKFLQPAERPAHFATYLPAPDGIIYVARVNEGFYRGSEPQENLAALKKLGIRTIINLHLTDDYPEQARAAGLEYFRIPMRPDEAPSADQVEQFLKLVTDPSRLPVYVHCSMGIDRTGVMSGIYRIEHDGWTNEQAVAEMNFFGHAPIWHDLGEYLENYRKK